MTMKIGIDISLSVGQPAGVGVYSSQLVQGLAQLDHVNEYTLFPFFYYIMHPDYKQLNIVSQYNFKNKFQHLSKVWIDYLWNTSDLDRSDILGSLDILHSTTFCVPSNIKSKLVVTIHDISFETHPQFHVKTNIDHCRNGTLDAVRCADKIIAVSEHTKRDLILYFQCDAEKIAVIYHGSNTILKRTIDKDIFQPICQKYYIYKPYIFNVGTIEPRKNILSLIKAYAGLSPQLQAQYDLVIAGGRGWLDDSIFEFVKEKNLQEQIKFLGYVSDHELASLYSNAEVFVYPSFYEGFGFPILEAMACGAPVICSNTSSMPEVGGDAALYIDPTQKDQGVQNIQSYLEQLLGQSKELENLRTKSLKQAKNFSWKNCAQKTLELYQSIVNV